MTEAEGTALLTARFTDAGYRIAANVRFEEGDISVDLDGWDAEARVGFEYITREAGDDLQFTEETLARFEERMRRAELFVLLVDEHEAVSAEELDAAAKGFLEMAVAARAPTLKASSPR